jgi:hypothetical protein
MNKLHLATGKLNEFEALFKQLIDQNSMVLNVLL